MNLKKRKVKKIKNKNYTFQKCERIKNKKNEKIQKI